MSISMPGTERYKESLQAKIMEVLDKGVQAVQEMAPELHITIANMADSRYHVAVWFGEEVGSARSGYRVYEFEAGAEVASFLRGLAAGWSYRDRQVLVDEMNEAKKVDESKKEGTNGSVSQAAD